MISITCDKCKRRIDFSARIETARIEANGRDQSVTLADIDNEVLAQLNEVADHSFALDDKRYLICKTCNTDYENISHELELSNTKQLKEWIEKV